MGKIRRTITIDRDNFIWIQRYRADKIKENQEETFTKVVNTLVEEAITARMNK